LCPLGRIGHADRGATDNDDRRKLPAGVRIQKAVGLQITVHQFSHAGAAIYLKHHPGDYEMVRRVLGHRSIQTTVKFYCGLETIAATEQFGKLIREQIDFNDEPDE
jgi:integrase